MKKIFTLFISLSIIFALNAQKKVGYIYFVKPTVVVPQTDDPFLRILQADQNFTVTVNALTDVSATATVDLSSYDLVVIQESFSSSAAILKPTGALEITKLNKPTIYNKTYAFRSSGNLGTGGVGTAAENTGSLCVKVAPANKTNALFTACEFVGDSLKLFNGFTDDLANSAGTKAINFTYGTDAVTSATVLAEPNKATSSGTTMICINDIPKGTIVGTTQTTAERMITLGFNYGALLNANNATANCLTLMRNAAYILTGQTVPSTPATLPTYTQLAQTNKLNYVRSGNQIQINFGTVQNAIISVYSLSGQLVKNQIVNSNNTTIDLSGKAKGVYIVKVSGAKVNGTQKFTVQ